MEAEMLIEADGKAPAASRVMVLHLTYLCNVKCHYCYVDNTSHHMPLDQAKKSIDFFLDKIAPSSNTTLFFLGGEPLAVPRLLKQVVAYGKRRGIQSFGLGTNGTLINRRWVDYFVKNNFFVHMSLDGVRGSQDANRPMLGGKGSFDKVDRALDLLGGRAGKLPLFEIRHTFTPETLQDLAASIRYYADKDCIGSTRICLMPAMLPIGRWDRLMKSGRLAPELQKQMDGVVDVYLEKRKAGRALNLYINECLSDVTPLSEHAPSDNYSCGAGKITFTFNMQGDIYPCHNPAPHPEFRDNKDYVLGDIRTGLTHLDRVEPYLGLPRNVHHSCPHWNRFFNGVSY
jgi:uncharacterized protein